jgi:predicted PurR-regulated permease PerM
MGNPLRLHPLLVIFGLLAGAEIYGFAGILVALPLLAAGRAAWEFFSERIVFEKWRTDAPLVEIGLEEPGEPDAVPEPPPGPTG